MSSELSVDNRTSLPSVSLLPTQSRGTTATWDLYYSARATWGPLVGALGPYDPLNASFWHALTEVFQTNEYTAFQLYNTHLSRGAHVAPCTLAADDMRYPRRAVRE
ncbi:hypothetical protein OF83DRAFT_1178424 [Amylostereum chailletii]|nr:hypothetical protein OF83DRAFT_1178424 [Amylostereum chailletii]